MQKINAQNLLLNGSFEEENTCSEYKLQCAPEAWISSSFELDDYYKNYATSHSGKHCMSIEMGAENSPFERSFIRSQLLCGLNKGNKYSIEFFIKKSNNFLLDSIGISFTNSDPLYEKQSLKNLSPTTFLLSLKNNNLNQDTAWQNISFTYTANGDESFFMIGNFAKKDIIGFAARSHLFVYIDDVSITPLNEKETLCSDWEQYKEDIYNQNERHQYLERKIKENNKQPPLVILNKNIIPKIDTLLIPDVLFISGQKELTTTSYKLLDTFFLSIANQQIDSLIIEGHADSTGNYIKNEQLAIDRAKSVKTYLRQHNYLSNVPIKIKGFGSRKPIASNATPVGRKRNRRVRLLLYKHA